MKKQGQGAALARVATGMLFVICFIACTSKVKQESFVLDSTTTSIDTIQNRPVVTTPHEFTEEGTTPTTTEPSQELDSPGLEFNDFVRLFQEDGITPIEKVYSSSSIQGIKNTLPDSAVEWFIMPDKPASSTGEVYFAKEAIMVDSTIILIYAVFIPAGPGLFSIRATSYNLFTEMKASTVELGDIFSGRDESADCSYRFDYDARVLIVKNSSKTQAPFEAEKKTSSERHFGLRDDMLEETNR